MTWWMRPLVRLIAAILLPLVVPAIITGALWALPGDPASIICPPESCDGSDGLAERFNLHRGPAYFYMTWISSAASMDFGRGWTRMQGLDVYQLLIEAIPMTGCLVCVALIPLLVGTMTAALGWLPRKLDWLWQLLGLVPAVILALFAAAYVEISYGVTMGDWRPMAWRLLLGGMVLALADGALSGAVVGTRSVFEEEVKQRYVQVAILRGESTFSNALPNVLPGLIGQLRGRLLTVLSGAVVVEVIVGVPGLGGLLFDGTLGQDYGVVLGAAFAFSAFSGLLMFLQAVSEIAVALYVRRSPAGVLT